MMKKVIGILLTVVTFWGAASASVITYTTGTAFWTNATKWVGGAVPTAADDVVIPALGLGNVITITNNQAISVASMVVSGATVYVNGTAPASLNVSGNVTQSGTSMLQTRAGNLSIINISGDYVLNAGTVKTLQSTTSTVRVAGDLTAGSSATFNFTLNNGVSFGSLLVGGTTTLGNSALTLATLTGAAGMSNTLALIVNSSANAVVGSFTNATFDVSTYTIQGTEYTLRKIDYDGGGVANDIVLTTVVPEPATIGMLGLGALITVIIRRMRTR